MSTPSIDEIEADFQRRKAMMWQCGKCGYRQYTWMACYCPEFEVMRAAWAANQNIATVEAP